MPVPIKLFQRFDDVIVFVGVACEDRLSPRPVFKREIDDRAVGQRDGFAQAAVGNADAGFEFDESVDGVACSKLLDIASLQRSGG
jgi:hypothetical protein